MSTNKEPNRLINEKSPYLLQHAHNPVDWYPWGDEAFVKAKKEDKPIFLSIGYSSCHWCHVMERECFEDTEVAEALNSSYISIKVDREERPDIDHFYMEACTSITGQGGWPLSCFLTPDRKPFYAGTYFPKTAGRGTIGFIDLLGRISALWKNDRKKIINVGNDLEKSIIESSTESIAYNVGKGNMMQDLPGTAFSMLAKNFDNVFGGFGNAPKFPSVHNLLFLIRYGIEFSEEKAIKMVVKTLKSMAAGGIHDHIGGGFCRYSTDREWLVPHFEKMMYDNAMLLEVLSEVSAVSNPETSKRFISIAERIADYCIREMKDVSGGFYTAQDADSEGFEGKYYIWSSEEITEVLGTEDSQRFCDLFDITEDGNFEGRSIPNHVKRDIHDDEYNFCLYCFEKLLKKRSERVPPLKDDKIVASVNGLMAAALAVTGRIFGRQEYIQLSIDAVNFVLNNHTKDGRLMGSYRAVRGNNPATFDDYAYIIRALIELSQATLDDRWITGAVIWAKKAEELFYDNNDNLFFLSGSDVYDIPVRQKSIYDGALPGGNSVMIDNYLKLWHITGEEKYLEFAEKMIQSLVGYAHYYPSSMTGFLSAYLYYLNGGTDVVLTEGRGIYELKKIVGGFRPFVTVSTKAAAQPEEKAAALVCRNHACLTPVDKPAELKALLE